MKLIKKNGSMKKKMLALAVCTAGSGSGQVVVGTGMLVDGINSVRNNAGITEHLNNQGGRAAGLVELES